MKYTKHKGSNTQLGVNPMFKYAWRNKNKMNEIWKFIRKPKADDIPRKTARRKYKINDND